MQIWKSTDTFVFTQKWYAEGFSLQQHLFSALCAHQIYELLLYKLTEAKEYVKKYPTF